MKKKNMKITWVRCLFGLFHCRFLLASMVCVHWKETCTVRLCAFSSNVMIFGSFCRMCSLGIMRFHYAVPRVLSNNFPTTFPILSDRVSIESHNTGIVIEQSEEDLEKIEMKMEWKYLFVCGGKITSLKITSRKYRQMDLSSLFLCEAKMNLGCSPTSLTKASFWRFRNSRWSFSIWMCTV